MTTAEIALVVSGVALLVSIASLWVNSLKPFELALSHDAPTFRLYKITPDRSGTESGATWWIPSFDVGLSFYNSGRRPGEVLDVRIVAELRGYRSHRTFTFYPKWIVDYSTFNRDRVDRFKWIGSAVVREWYPFMLSAHDNKDLHVVLEGDRWEHTMSGDMTLRFEVIAGRQRKWTPSRAYTLALSEDMFEDSSSYTAYDSKIEQMRQPET